MDNIIDRLSGIDNLSCFSQNESDRVRWLDKLKITKIKNTGDNIVFVSTLGDGKSNEGKVMSVYLDGQHLALKLLRGKDKEERARREYAGLLIGSTEYPSIFPKPVGLLTNKEDRVSGVLMDIVENKKTLWSLVDKDLYLKHMRIKFLENFEIPNSFFDTINDVVQGLGKKNIYFRDLNMGGILVDKEWNPSLVDVQYQTKQMPLNAVNRILNSVEGIRRLNNGGEIVAQF